MSKYTVTVCDTNGIEVFNLGVDDADQMETLKENFDFAHEENPTVNGPLCDVSENQTAFRVSLDEGLHEILKKWANKHGGIVTFPETVRNNIHKKLVLLKIKVAEIRASDWDSDYAVGSGYRLVDEDIAELRRLVGEIEELFNTDEFTPKED